MTIRQHYNNEFVVLPITEFNYPSLHEFRNVITERVTQQRPSTTN